jgi:hypothetical protein
MENLSGLLYIESGMILLGVMQWVEQNPHQHQVLTASTPQLS